MIIFSTISQKGQFHGQLIAVADNNPFLHGGDVSYFRGEKMSNLRPRGERVTWGQHKHIHHRWRQENTSALFWLMFTQQNLCGGPAEEPDLVLYVPHLFHSYNVCRMAQIKIQCFYGKSSPWRNAQFRSTSAWQDFNGMNALFLQLKYMKVTPTYTSPMILDPSSWDDVTDHFLGLVHLRYNYTFTLQALSYHRHAQTKKRSVSNN